MPINERKSSSSEQTDEPPERIYPFLRPALTIVVAIIVGMASPSVAHESTVSDYWLKGIKDPYSVLWNYSSLEAPVLIKTVFTPVSRELKRVRYFGNGTCVPYARFRTGIRLYGWAGSLLKGAAREGYSTSSVPVLGAMVITKEGGGHVAVVEEVLKDRIRISEQNFEGLYVVSTRWLSVNDDIIVGYIY